ncbi:hypothetical protein [Larkinella humicola]|uniref:Uncharacterized protein n=1 Tax=Larkinella humicola TaxID=2607654 RepID=A0A5N1JBN4_9BACT|nr:hypothetical protein [Larkinella humicola]KAA9349153.1 hypothetical protein F0P93_22400 [Larkinella humicola]
MNKNRRILFIAALIFTLIVIFIAVDMGRRTTAPWNKKRQLERALPTELDGTALDSAALDVADTLFVEDSTSR